MSKKSWDFRDMSLGLQVLRNFLLGRKHNLHGRFPPLVSPRTIPPPEIPRSDNQYSNKYYCKRSAMNSVYPPVVAPIAEGPPIKYDPTKKPQPGGIKPNSVVFHCAPTPGPAFWWDGHCYYEQTPDLPRVPRRSPLPDNTKCQSEEKKK